VIDITRSGGPVIVRLGVVSRGEIAEALVGAPGNVKVTVETGKWERGNG
jgi:hypothetical protein